LVIGYIKYFNICSLRLRGRCGDRETRETREMRGTRKMRRNLKFPTPYSLPPTPYSPLQL